MNIYRLDMRIEKNLILQLDYINAKLYFRVTFEDVLEVPKNYTNPIIFIILENH